MRNLQMGIDIGSTTAKVAVLDQGQAVAIFSRIVVTTLKH